MRMKELGLLRFVRVYQKSETGGILSTCIYGVLNPYG
jgi:hypothetical protein